MLPAQCHGGAVRLQTVEGFRGLGAGTMRFSSHVSNPSTTAGAHAPYTREEVTGAHHACRST